MADTAYPPSDPPPVYQPPKDPYQGTYPQPPPQGYGQQPPPQGYGQQPPPQGYPQQPGVPQGQYTQSTVVVTPAVTSLAVPMRYGANSQIMSCPHCRAQITTTTSTKIGLFTWMVVGIWALIGLLFFPPLWLCCCIPCCIPSCKDVIHHCPNCNQMLGIHERMH